MNRRFLSALLVIALLLTCFCLPCFAEETEDSPLFE